MSTALNYFAHISHTKYNCYSSIPCDRSGVLHPDWRLRCLNERKLWRLPRYCLPPSLPSSLWPNRADRYDPIGDLRLCEIEQRCVGEQATTPALLRASVFRATINTFLKCPLLQLSSLALPAALLSLSLGAQNKWASPPRRGPMAGLV